MYSEKHNAYFIHIPKTGGTSIIRSLLELEHSPHPLNHEELKLFDPEEVYKPKRHPRASTMNIVTGGDTIVFTVVRDPIDRFLSALAFGCPHLGKWNFDSIIDIHIPNLKIIKYEELEEEWKKLFPDVELGRSNNRVRRNKKKKEDLPQEVIDRVLKNNPFEAKLYGYV